MNFFLYSQNQDKDWNCEIDCRRTLLMIILVLSGIALVIIPPIGLFAFFCAIRVSYHNNYLNSYTHW